MSAPKNNSGKKKGPSTRRRTKVLYRRKRGRKTSQENQALLDLLKPTEQDVTKMLAAQMHIGRRCAHVNMKRYVWKRRADGIFVINLEKTWEKIMLAARILVTVQDPSDICVMSSRTYGQRGAIKFAHYTGATPLVGKWVPGTFTNPQNKAFMEPRILIVDDPTTCFAALRETSYTGIPVIALCGTDNNTRFVDCAIPCNNRGKLSVGLMFWLLARELLRMNGTIPRKIDWEASVDLFFYRSVDEIRAQQRRQELKRNKQQADEQQEFAPVAEYAPEIDALQPQQEEYEYGQLEDWNQPQRAIEDWDDQPPADQYAYDNQYVDEQQFVPQYEQQAPPQQDAAGMHMQNW
jgi:small subunit ribosomal protein SAe